MENLERRLSDALFPNTVSKPENNFLRKVFIARPYGVIGTSVQRCLGGGSVRDAAENLYGATVSGGTGGV